MLEEKPVLMVFGSYTWPPFRQRVAANESLYNRYSDRIHFIIVYTVEAHPSPLVNPRTYEERVEQAIKCSEEDSINVTVIVDEVDNSVWRAYGARPNNAYLIDTDGTIIEKQIWYDPRMMERAITNYLGEG